MPTIQEVLARETDAWMALPGVHGTGIGLCDGSPCIKVFASVPADDLGEHIPTEIDGYTVVIEASGGFQARDTVG